MLISVGRPKLLVGDVAVNGCVDNWFYDGIKCGTLSVRYVLALDSKTPFLENDLLIHSWSFLSDETMRNMQMFSVTVYKHPGLES